MKYVFVDESWEDYLYWQSTDNKKLKKINEPTERYYKKSIQRIRQA